MDWPFAILNGALCATAILFAAFSSGRREALPLAALLFADWLLYVLSWTAFKPANLFHGLLNSKDLWAIMDGILGACAVVTAYRYWWGWALLLSVMCQEVLHAAYWLRVYDFETYSGFLDITFLAQVALFLVLGGRGVRDYLNRCFDRLGVSRRGQGPTHARAVEGGD